MYDDLSGQSRQRIKDKIELLREEQTSRAVQEIIEFDKTPAELKAAMDGFIIGQERGKKIISTAIAFHYKRLGGALKKALAESEGDIDLALRNTKSSPGQHFDDRSQRLRQDLHQSNGVSTRRGGFRSRRYDPLQ